MSSKVSRTTRVGLALTAAAVALTVVPTTVASSASAGDESYHLSYQTYPDGRHVIARWNPCQKDITYKVNLTYAAKTHKGRLAALRDVKGAVARVSAATGIAFRYTGTSGLIPKDTRTKSWAARETGAEVYIAWVKQSSSKGRSDLLGATVDGDAAGSGGYAYKFWKVGNAPWQGVTGRGFVVLDSSQNSSFKSGFGSGVTRGDLLLHELGHVMGMDHVASKSEIMYPTIEPHKVSRYGAGDRLGLAKLGRQSGCISVPGWVWHDLS